MNVLVTGASGGIGRALALGLGRAGYAVAVHYFSNEAAIVDLCRTLDAEGVKHIKICADVTQPEQARAAVDEVVRAWGSIDGLVNNAGVARDRSILRMSPEEWNTVVNVNLSGSFWCLQAAARAMVASKKGGWILNVGSLLGLKGAVGCSNYVASKAGVVGLTKSAAWELGRYQIRVNAVLPGFHGTAISAGLSTAQRQRVMGDHVLGTSTDMEELVRWAVTLAESKTVSGQVFNVDNRLLF